MHMYMYMSTFWPVLVIVMPFCALMLQIRLLLNFRVGITHNMMMLLLVSARFETQRSHM